MLRPSSAVLALDSRLVNADGSVLFEQWVPIELRARAGLLGRGYEVSF